MEPTLDRCPACGTCHRCGTPRELGPCACVTLDLGGEVFAPGADEAVGPPFLCGDCAAGATRSPCNGDCVLERASQTCRGCLRTIDEITGWSRCGARDRRVVYRRIRARRLVALYAEPAATRSAGLHPAALSEPRSD